MKLMIMLGLTVLSVFCCTKYKADTDHTGNSDIDKSIENKEIVSTIIYDTIPILEIPENIKTNLLDYFPDGNYQILEELLDVNYRRIIFAVHSIKNIMDYKYDELSICDTIVGFEIIEGSFQKYLLIKDFRFINSDNSILYDFSEKYPGIFGFNISYSYPKVDGYTPGLNIDTYFDDGERIADTFTIRWNEDNKNFEKNNWIIP
jgi:hypothetical protein